MKAIELTKEARLGGYMSARAASLGMDDEDASLQAATEAYWASPSVTLVEWPGSPQSWPPTKVTPERTMRQAAIDVLDDKTKLKMAVQYATSAYYGSTVKGAKSMSAAKVRDATINIFGLKAAPTRGHISKLVKQQSVGTEPRSAGRPKHVTADVTQGVADYCTMLRAWKLPVFHSTVISHFQRLIDGEVTTLKLLVGLQRRRRRNQP
jgi:surface antigen